MRFVRWSVRFLCTIAILIIGIYTVISLAVAFFIVTGTLDPGGPMWIDSETPSLMQTLMFAGAGAALVTGLALLRQTGLPQLRIHH